MLAMRIKANVAHKHEIVIPAGFTERAVEHFDRTLAIALVNFIKSADDALRSLQQTLARRIVASIGNERAHGSFRLLA
jgi:hypothetical protein